VLAIGGIKDTNPLPEIPWHELFSQIEKSPVRCFDEQVSDKIREAIDQAKKEGDTLGGLIETIITKVPAGLGSHVHWERKIDARLAGAFMSIQGIKGVEIGLGSQGADLPGSRVHDEIGYKEKVGFFRYSNHAGGIEGGMSNGEPIVIRAAMKPIPTLMKPLKTVDRDTKEQITAQVERSDVCAVPAACVVGEAVAAWEIARLLQEKFGGDTLEEMKERVTKYRIYLRQV
jgi:chorismate synthase